MNDQKLYNPEWFKKQKQSALDSAEAVVPIVMDMVAPNSVVDVGCGMGAWLKIFQNAGVKDILGLDGAWVVRKELCIPETSFKEVDINKPFTIGRKADLAMSLEVGEHLPDSSADGLVKNLIGTAPVVLFSAAIPAQPGTGHINGQWPDYWAKIFKKYGYIPVDCIRRKVWENPKVGYWYAQNGFIYVKESELNRYPKLKKEIENGFSTTLALVHPERYRYALKSLPPFFFRVRRKIKKVLRIS
jgi:SAM-dependent methyltransferase